MIQILRWSTVLFAITFLASCSSHSDPASTTSPVVKVQPTETVNVQTKQSESTNSPTFVARDGLKITPLEVKGDDTSRILDIKMWKFKVTTPKTPVSLNFQLELRQKSKPTKTITNFTSGLSANKEREMLVAFYPVDNFPGGANKMKFYISTGSAHVSGYADNPTTNLGGSMVSNPARIQDDSLVLMEFSRGGHFPSPENSSIVLTIKVVKP